MADFALEKAHAVGHAAQGQAFGVGGLQIGADHKFGGAAADVDHQHFVAVGRQRVYHAGVNQARFFAPGDHFDGKAQRCFGFGDEFVDVFGHAKRVGGHHAHLLGRKFAQPLAEFFQAVERALLRSLIKVFVFIKAGGKAHHLFERIDDFELAVDVFTHLQTEAVGA